MKFTQYPIYPTQYIYSIKDKSEAVYITGDYECFLKIEYDDFSMKTELTLKRFGSIFGTLRFDAKINFYYFVRIHAVLGL